jgi:hypothetical protein
VLAERSVALVPWMWAAVLSGLVIWWIRSRRASSWDRLDHTMANDWRSRRAGRMATFAEILAAAGRSHIPLDEAVTLAPRRAAGTAASHARLPIHCGEATCRDTTGFRHYCRG